LKTGWGTSPRPLRPQGYEDGALGRVAAVDEVAITRAGGEVLDRLEPLWLELHHHHQAIAGAALEPYVGDAHSWAARRGMYAGFLEAPHGSFVLLAERDAALLGYAMVAIAPVEDNLSRLAGK
jgi:hypothetical protein